MSENTMKSRKSKSAQKAEKVFSLGIITPLKKSSNAESFFRLVEPLEALNFEVKVLSGGDQKTEEALFAISGKYENCLEVLEAVPTNKQKIIERAQVVLFMEAPSEADLLVLAKNNGVVIVPETDETKLVNFDAQKEVGNCFVYDSENFWDLLATILRAYETFKFPYDWSQCKKSFKKTMDV